jgi:hypothetical protein
MTTISFAPGTFSLNGRELTPYMTHEAITEALGSMPEFATSSDHGVSIDYYFWNEFGISYYMPRYTGAAKRRARLCLYLGAQRESWVFTGDQPTRPNFMGTLHLWNRIILTSQNGIAGITNLQKENITSRKNLILNVMHQEIVQEPSLARQISDLFNGPGIDYQKNENTGHLEKVEGAKTTDDFDVSAPFSPFRKPIFPHVAVGASRSVFDASNHDTIFLRTDVTHYMEAHVWYFSTSKSLDFETWQETQVPAHIEIELSERNWREEPAAKGIQNNKLISCAACGEPVSPNAVTCMKCGEPVSVAFSWRSKPCSNCRRPMSAFADDCSSCHHPNTLYKQWGLLNAFVGVISGIGLVTGVLWWSRGGIILSALSLTFILASEAMRRMIRRWYSHRSEH